MKKIVFAAFIFLISVSAFGQKGPGKWAGFDGNKIYYYDSGKTKSRTALVLVHGWTCNADFWKDSMNAFPAYRVIAIDLPGHGRSDKPRTKYSMEYFARSIDAVLREAKVSRAVLAGHSMGTPVIRQFYRLYPEKTLGLVVVDGALRAFAPKDEMEKFVAPLRVNYRENAAKFVDGMLQPVTDENLKRTIRDSMLATPDHVGISAMNEMIDERIWADDKINVPVLAVLARSPFWPAGIEESYRAIAPNLEFQMWTGVSHFLMMEKPAEFNAQVKGFVAKNRLL